MRSDVTRSSLPLTGGSTAATVKLHPLLAGEMLAPLSFLLGPVGLTDAPRALGQLRRSRRRWIPVPAFLVEHPTAGALLIDTGFAPEVVQHHFTHLGPVIGPIYAFFRMRVRPEQGIRRQLQERGIDPDTIKTVVISHLHLDHASGVSEFPQAELVVSRQEWTWATGPGSSLRGYWKPRLVADLHWRTVDFAEAREDGVPGFERTLDLYGDGSVRLLPTPGHSRGHMSVLLRLAEREALLTADAACFWQELADPGDPSKQPVPVFLPLFGPDRPAARETFGRLKDFVKARPDALVIPAHDPDVWSSLDPVYA